MDISTDRGKLFNRFKDLRGRWHEVQAVWNDPVRKDFEETYWPALEERLQAAMHAMDRMAQVLTQARQECS